MSGIVTITTEEYNKLVRERIAILRTMLEKHSAVLTDDVRLVVGEKNEEGSET